MDSMRKHAATTVPSSAADFLPDHRTVESLRDAEQSCRGCELFQRATQAVAGEGPSTAEMVLVGETPGDEEDKTGHPFVGPAGRCLIRHWRPPESVGKKSMSRMSSSISNGNLAGNADCTPSRALGKSPHAVRGSRLSSS